MALLLEQHGFDVHRTARTDPTIAAIVDRYRPHVVLLDATSSLADAAARSRRSAACTTRFDS